MRYIKCMLILDTEEELTFLLGVMVRESGAQGASEEHRKHAQDIYAALRDHFITT